MNTTDNGKRQAQAQMDSITRMVTALGVDYDRLAELREEREDWGTHPAYQTWTKAHPISAEELAELEEAAGECTSDEEAREAIQSDPLSIEVRSGWVSHGDNMTAEEFRIVLCTGGPHVEIRGEIERGCPVHCRLMHQDWGTPLTEHIVTHVEYLALCTYADAVGCFDWN